MGHGQPAGRLGLVMPDHRPADFLQVVLGLKLIDVLVADHRVGRIGHSGVLFDRDAEAGVVNSFGHAHERLDHHIHREVSPLVERAPQLVFVLPAFRIFTAQGQLAVEVHLIPAHLVDHHHGAFGPARVEFAPQGALFFLNRQGGNFGHLRGQLPNNGHILFVNHEWVLPVKGCVCACTVSPTRRSDNFRRTWRSPRKSC